MSPLAYGLIAFWGFCFCCVLALLVKAGFAVASDADEIAREHARRASERRAIRERRERRARPTYFEHRADQLGSEAEAFLAGRPR